MGWQVYNIAGQLQVQQMVVCGSLLRVCAWCYVDSQSESSWVVGRAFHLILLSCLAGVSTWGLLMFAGVCRTRRFGTKWSLRQGPLTCATRVGLVLVRLVAAFTVWGAACGWLVRVLESPLWNGVVFVPIVIFCLVAMRTHVGVVGLLCSGFVFLLYVAITVTDLVTGGVELPMQEEGEDVCETPVWAMLSCVFLLSVWGLLTGICELPLEVNGGGGGVATDSGMRGGHELDSWQIASATRVIVWVGVVVPLSVFAFDSGGVGMLLSYKGLWRMEQDEFMLHGSELIQWIVQVAAVCGASVVEACVCTNTLWEAFEHFDGNRHHELSFISYFEMVSACVLGCLMFAFLLVASQLHTLWIVYFVAIASTCAVM